jgi:hypothetical protein
MNPIRGRTKGPEMLRNECPTDVTTADIMVSGIHQVDVP